MPDNSSRIASSNILKPLAKDVERDRRLIEAGESFEQRHKETLEHDRDELRRLGDLAADWKPNETNADHDYWDAWSERIRKAAGELKAAGETEIAGQLLTFCRQIDDRDEVTCNSDFRFEKLDELLAAVMAGDKKEVSGDGTPSAPAHESQTPVAKLSDAGGGGEESANNSATAKKSKRSTQPGEAREKLISALTKHHTYEAGSCANWEPIGSNVLAKKANVGKATASRFFNEWFGSAKKATDGYRNYRIACNGQNKLIAILKTMNGDMPRPGEVLFGSEVPDAAENPEHQGDRRRKPRASELHRHDDR